jgi:hypothetical protein
MFPALRVIAVLHALSLVMQPILAGFFLSGHDNLIDMHSLNGMLLVLLSLLQTVLAVLLWRRNVVRRQIFTQALVILVLEVVQLTVGFSHMLWIHIPLGTLLMVGTAMLMDQIMGKTSLPATAVGPARASGVTPAGAEAAE